MSRGLSIMIHYDINKAIDFLVEHKWILDFHIVEFFTKDLWNHASFPFRHIENVIRDDYDLIRITDLEDLDESLRCFFKSVEKFDIRKHVEYLVQISDANEYDKRHRMSVKKSYEVF